jgi:hypothetical protein
VHQVDDIEAPETDGSGAARTAPRDAATERASRYLDLWERNLAHISLNGPPPKGAGRGRAGHDL